MSNLIFVTNSGRGFTNCLIVLRSASGPLRSWYKRLSSILYDLFAKRLSILVDIFGGLENVFYGGNMQFWETGGMQNASLSSQEKFNALLNLLFSDGIRPAES